MLPSSSMLFITARDFRFMPMLRSAFPPAWKPFSMTIPTPVTSAPAVFTMSISPRDALPFARKSSIMSTLSSECRNSFERRILYA